MLFRYIKFVDTTLDKEVCISAKNEEDVINYILENREQFELPEYFTSESEIDTYITDKDSLLSYWSYKSYLSDGIVQCKVEEIVADVII